jgi:hypothetical protein
MLTRTRNELLIAAGFGLLTLLVGVFYFRTRIERAERPVSVPAVTVLSDSVPGDRCPALTSWVASPLQTSVGSSIDVGASARDEDAGEKLRFSWEPAAGFEDPHAAATRFRCSEPGVHTLTLNVSDDHHPHPCATRLTLGVACVAR